MVVGKRKPQHTGVDRSQRINHVFAKNPRPKASATELRPMVQAPITDSPWLWFTLFPAVGLIALLATGGKFGDRQAGIERRAQARAAVAEGLDVAEDAAGKKSATGVPEYSAPGETRIGLVPLAATLGVLCAGSLGMLIRERLMLRGL